jgi:hypothetical protein
MLLLLLLLLLLPAGAGSRSTRAAPAAVLGRGTAKTPQRAAGRIVVDVPTLPATVRSLVVDPLAAPGHLVFNIIQDAINASQPGDTIWVKNGTYRESPTFTRSGTRESPITLAAFSGDRPVVIPASSYEHAVVIRAQWIIIDGLEITLGYDGIVVYGSHPGQPRNSVHATIRRCHIHNNGDRTPQTTTGQGILVVSVYDLLIEENTIERNGLLGPDPFQVHGIYLSDFYQSGISHVQIRGNTFRESGGGGIQVFKDAGSGFASEVTIESNNFENNVHELIAVLLSSSTIRMNTFTHDWHPKTSSPDTSVLWFELCHNITFTGNDIHSSLVAPSSASTPVRGILSCGMDCRSWQLQCASVFESSVIV